jgi:acetyltransferase-like isoleucine patch superfamily enzyme
MNILRFLRALWIKYKKVRKFRNSSLHPRATINLKAELTGCQVAEGGRVAQYADVRHTIIGRYSSIGRYSKLTHCEIGNFCSISWDVTINARNHTLNCLTTSAFPYVRRLGFTNRDDIHYETVLIGHDVWIGAGVIILPGVRIGDGSVVGAGSVVTKDVAPFSIVAGNPAREIRKRFSEAEVEEIYNMEWWFWDESKIKDNLSIFTDRWSSS